MDHVIASACRDYSADRGSLIAVNDAGQLTGVIPNPDHLLSQHTFRAEGKLGLPGRGLPQRTVMRSAPAGWPC